MDFMRYSKSCSHPFKVTEIRIMPVLRSVFRLEFTQLLPTYLGKASACVFCTTE